MLTAELIDKALKSAHNTADKLQTLGYKVPEFTIVYDVVGKHAGWAKHSEKKIRLNPYFLINNEEDMLTNTIPHEVCHLAIRLTYGYVKSHGIEWKRAMWKLGLNPARCHSYGKDPNGRKTRKFIFKCVHGDAKFGMAIARKIRQGSVYRRRQCNCKIDNFIEVINLWQS